MQHLVSGHSRPGDVVRSLGPSLAAVRALRSQLCPLLQRARTHDIGTARGSTDPHTAAEPDSRTAKTTWTMTPFLSTAAGHRHVSLQSSSSAATDLRVQRGIKSKHRLDGQSCISRRSLCSLGLGCFCCLISFIGQRCHEVMMSNAVGVLSDQLHCPPRSAEASSHKLWTGGFSSNNLSPGGAPATGSSWHLGRGHL